MKRITKNIFALVTCLLFLGITAQSFAAIPHLINYQGKVVNEDNAPLNGSYTINFKIYDQLAAGSLLWQETHSGIVVQEGLFSVLLGSVTALNLPFDVPYYLEIKVGTEVMSPRQMISSSGYAIRAEVAETVDGLDPGLVGTKTVDEANIADGKALVYNSSTGKLEYEDMSAPQAKNGFCFGFLWEEQIFHGTDSPTIVSVPFTKTPGLNYIKVHCQAKLGGGSPKLKIVVDNLTSPDEPILQSSYIPYDITLDVSSLTDGVTYTAILKGYATTASFVRMITFEHS